MTYTRLKMKSSVRGPVGKTVLIGEGGVGKTSLAVRYTEDRFDEKMKMTIGVNFASKKVKLEGKEVTLLIWDLGGQPRFQEVVSSYFVGALLAIAVYEVPTPYTLYRLEDWIRRLHESVPDCPVFIVGNKTDERGDGSVTESQAMEFAAKYGARHFFVSAKNGTGVEDMFNAAAALVAQRLR
ncbi:MAG: GTP-binding protein [Candidatus Thorarchaeota archaeon]|nr:GTP-binding protein [Candidatus Thorarchaeota archaeon]